MRKAIGVVVVMMALAVGGRRASAQILDPSTGMMVDMATDPFDAAAVMSGQPGNVGTEAMYSAMAQMNATSDEIAAESAASAQASMDASINAMNESDDAPVAPALPSTPKPVITPGGGTFTAGVQVTIADSDLGAAVFYTTNGKKPTTSSARFVAPIVVNAKMKVEALAFDVNMQPSGVVSKTFKVKVAKGSSLRAG
jgi:Chitobiase/beta-hexosaminidase C-terminal domain